MTDSAKQQNVPLEKPVKTETILSEDDKFMIKMMDGIYGPGVTQGLRTLDDWGKKIEESLKSDPAFEKKIKALPDGPLWSQYPQLKVKFTLWINERIDSAKTSAEARPVIVQAQKDRMQMAKSLGVSPIKSETPEAKPTAQDKKPAAPEATPAVPETKPAAPAEKAGDAKPEKKGEDIAQFMQKSKAAAASGTLGDLVGKLMKSFSKLSGYLTGFMDKLKGAAKPATEKPEQSGNPVPESTEKADTKPVRDKSVEYVTNAIGLTPKENPQKLLESLTSSGRVMVSDSGRLKELKPGDVLFFKKTNDKGEAYAYLSAVVSTDPTKMNMIPPGASVPEPFTIETSTFFKNEFLGFVKMPQKEGQSPKPATPN